METVIGLYKVKNVPNYIYLQMYKANFGADGLMQDALNEVRHDETKYGHCIVITNQDGDLVGWSLILQEHSGYSCELSELIIFMWVQIPYRKQGFATIMLTYGLTKFPNYTFGFTTHDMRTKKLASKFSKLFKRFKIAKNVASCFA